MVATGATHQQNLLKVLKAEITYREIKRRNLSLKKAGFGNVETFQGYDFEDITLLSTLTIDLLKQAQFLARQTDSLRQKWSREKPYGNCNWRRSLYVREKSAVFQKQLHL